MVLVRFTAIMLCALVAVTQSPAEDWTQFRGPDGNSISPSKPPVSWTPTDNVAWKVPLPGAGVSSPIIVGNKLIVTCYSGYGLDRQNPGDIKELVRHVVCFDAKTGKQIWKSDVKAEQPEDPYSGIGVVAHGYASHTPVTDGKNVYVFFGKSGALAFDLNGKQLWQTPLGKESDPAKWGSSSSPVLYNDILIVTASAESQSIVGLDTKTGKQIWKQEASGLDNVWGTPVLSKNSSGKAELVVSVPRELWGMDPQTGKLLWYSQATEADQASTSPYVHDGVVYAVTGRGGGSVAVRAGGSGEVTASNVVWTGRETSRFASPVGYQSKLFLVSGDTLTVVDEKSGEKLKQVRLQGGSNRAAGSMGGTDYPSPVVAGEKLYYVKGNGETFVFNATGEFDQVSVNLVTTDDEFFGGTPAVSDSRLYLRSNKNLYCVAETKKDLAANASENLIAKLAESTGGGGGDRGGRGGRGGGPGGPGGGGGPGGPGGGFDPAAIFKRLDADSDGKLSRKELDGNPMAERFADIDKNKDDGITQEEMQEGMRAAFGGGRGGPGGRGGGPSGRGGQDNRPQRPQRPSDK